MKSDQEIARLLNDHEKRISELESRLSKPTSKTATKDKQKLSDHVLRLRDSGFFSKQKTAEETHAKLQETYSCELNRVAVGLLRLAKRKKLRRASKTVNEKTYQAYVY
jgi:hypothetical protein